MHPHIGSVKMLLVRTVLLRHLVICTLSFQVANSQYYFNQSRKLNYYRENLQPSNRQAKFISFETLDDDMKVALEFVVPFLSMPFKKNADDATPHKTLVNINLSSLVLTGITVIAGVSTASALSHFVRMVSGKKLKTSKVKNTSNPYSFSYRSTTGDRGEASISEIIGNIEAVFRKYDIDITSCVQKVICFLVQDATLNVSRGRGTSTDKVVDGLTSNNWLLRFLTGTAVKEAIDAGRSNMECRMKYRYCHLSDYDIKEYLSYL